MSTIPISREIVREPSNGFIPTYPDKRFYHYAKAELVLGFIACEMKLTSCQTFLMGKGEMRSTISHKNYRPDMVAKQVDPVTCKFQKLFVFDFYGCIWHKCPIHEHPIDEIHPIRKDNGRPLKWGEIYELDAKRLKVLRAEFGEEVTVIYECEFERDYIHESGKHHEKWSQYLAAHPNRKLLDRKKRTESEILQMVKNVVAKKCCKQKISFLRYTMAKLTDF